MKSFKFIKVFHLCLWILAFLLPVFLLGSWLLGRQVKSLLIAELNKTLAVHVDVRHLDISIWSHFPNISIKATDIEVNESRTYYNLKAIEAAQLSLVFNLIDVIRKGPVIDKIQLEGAHIRLYQGRDGNNFSFFKPSSGKPAKALKLELKKIELRNCQVWFLDDSTGHSFNFESKNLLASGKFGEEKYKLAISGDALFDHLKLNNQTIFVGKRTFTDVDFEVNDAIKSYHISKGLFSLEDLSLKLEGDIIMVKNQPDLDLRFEGQQIDIGSMLSLLPNKLIYDIKGGRNSGKVYLKGFIKGRYAEGSWPETNIDFGGKNVRLEASSMTPHVKDFSFNGKWIRNKTRPDGYFKLDITQLKLGDGNLKGTAELNSFSNPELIVNANGNLNLAAFTSLLPTDQMTDVKGKIQFNLTGIVNLIPAENTEQKTSIQIIDLDGDIDLSGGSVFLTADSLSLEAVQAKLTFRNGHLKAHNAYAKSKGSDVLFKGEWLYFLPWVNDSLTEMVLIGSLFSQKLDLNAFIKHNDESETESSDALKLNLDVLVNNLTWEQHEVKDFKGLLMVSGSNFSLTNADMKTMEGSVHADLTLNESPEGRKALQLKLKTDHVSISQIFRRFNNFGQSTITEKHLSGFVGSEIMYEHIYDSVGNVDMGSVKALGVLEITQGRLKDFQPLKSLSKFVELRELQDIRFSDIKNTIEIKNGVIIIPHMKILNNALNLELSGTHNFENYMEYQIKINLTDLLAARSGWVKKKKEKNLEKGKEGGLNAFVTMKGTPENLKFKYDNKAVAKTIKTEAKKERKEFFDILKKDIKGIKQETPAAKGTVEWDE
jgi:uncharacterized protein involved in outer membrane biogenesis